MAAELKGFDAVVFDPPRQGAEAQARELAASKRAAASSRCPAIRPRSPATRASCVAAATGSLEVTPVDQFRYAAHVEIVARLEK